MWTGHFIRRHGLTCVYLGVGIEGDVCTHHYIHASSASTSFGKRQNISKISSTALNMVSVWIFIQSKALFAHNMWRQKGAQVIYIASSTKHCYSLTSMLTSNSTKSPLSTRWRHVEHLIAIDRRPGSYKFPQIELLAFSWRSTTWNLLTAKRRWGSISRQYGPKSWGVPLKWVWGNFIRIFYKFEGCLRACLAETSATSQRDGMDEQEPRLSLRETKWIWEPTIGYGEHCEAQLDLMKI